MRQKASMIGFLAYAEPGQCMSLLLHQVPGSYLYASLVVNKQHWERWGFLFVCLFQSFCVCVCALSETKFRSNFMLDQTTLFADSLSDICLRGPAPGSYAVVRRQDTQAAWRWTLSGYYQNRQQRNHFMVFVKLCWNGQVVILTTQSLMVTLEVLVQPVTWGSSKWRPVRFSVCNDDYNDDDDNNEKD